jgi:predicted RNA binding protein YcfA (HicA-like mRNA interferase family)
MTFQSMLNTYKNTYYAQFMKSWTSGDILRILSEGGWVVKHQVGSYVQLVHPTKPGKVAAPHPKKDLAPRTVKSIARQAGLNLEVYRCTRTFSLLISAALLQEDTL